MLEFTVSVVGNIVEHRGLRGLEQLEADWKRLHAALPARRRYHAYEAQLAYLEHLCAEPERARYLALAGDDGTVRAICPLEAAPDPSLHLPLRAWALPSHHHWLATDVLAPDDEARQALLPAVVAHLRSHREGRALLLLGPIRNDSALRGQAAALDPAVRCLHDTHPSAFFDCSLPYDQLLERLSKNFRRKLRVHHTKLQAAGEVDVTTVSGPEGLAAAFEKFLKIEASGWKGPAGVGSAIALHPRLVAFYRALMTTMTGPEDHCEINGLYLNGRCIASQFSMRTGEEYTILKIAYDEEFAWLSPGQLLMEATLKRCCADPGLRYIDLLTDAPWMRNWHTETMLMQQAHVALAPLWGRPLVALLKLRHGPARTLVRKYRAVRPWRRGPTSVRPGAHHVGEDPHAA